MLHRTTLRFVARAAASHSRVTPAVSSSPAAATPAFSTFTSVFNSHGQGPSRHRFDPAVALSNAFAADGLVGIQARFATKKSGGSTKNGRDSIGKRLGLKKFSGERVKAGNILVRQRGNSFHAGKQVYCAKDYTLHAKEDGRILYTKSKLTKKRQVHVVSEADYERHLEKRAAERAKPRKGWEGQEEAAKAAASASL